VNIAGLTPLSTVDYPGELSAVAFCQGCPWRCLYCHNPHLQTFAGGGQIVWSDVLAFLRRRQSLLDAFVFSGGEPTAQGDLPSAMAQVKELGFKVGLHTAGINPRVMTAVLPLTDWVGLDIKSARGSYPEITAVSDSGIAAYETLACLIKSGVAYEVRTTMHSAFLPESSLLDLAQHLSKLGVKRYVVQLYRNVGCTNPKITGLGAGKLSDAARHVLEGLFPDFCLR
jgi:pyruvate formate lyase activating enzyme